MYKPKSSYTTTVKVLSADLMPAIAITDDAIIKMNAYVQECPDEIGWFFTVKEDEVDKNLFIIEDCYLFPQEVHSTTTEVNSEKLAEFAEELMQLPNYMEIWNSLRGWGHSHVKMSVSPSPQDDTQMNFFQNAGQPFFIRAIANKNGEIKFDIYHYERGVIYTDVMWFEYPSIEDRTIFDAIRKLQAQLDAKKKQKEKESSEEIKEQISKKVKKLTYQYGGESRGSYASSNFQKHSQAKNTTKKTGSGTTEEDGTNDKVKNYLKCLSMKDVYDEFNLFELCAIGNHESRTAAIQEIERLRPNCILTQNAINLIIVASTKAVDDFYEQDFIKAHTNMGGSKK